MQNIITIVLILIYTGLIIYLRIITINQIKTIDGLKKELLQAIAELTRLTENQPETATIPKRSIKRPSKTPLK